MNSLPLSQPDGAARIRGVAAEDQRSDAELLAAAGREPEAFGVFYRRHVRSVLAYTLSRTRRPELAADLTAETFAVALQRGDSFDERRGPARAWLLSIASSKLVDAARRGQVEDRARRRLGIAPRELTDVDLERVEELADLGGGLDADGKTSQRADLLSRLTSHL